ncbi:DUF1566 domain-containing protein [Vibrio sp. WXL103]|uniref:Lcl C-terminal domain-containing protein n=1 Tax=Vibrio sp. WXL103 TaxID=3450710 RepID=UPI003EC7F9F9
MNQGKRTIQIHVNHTRQIKLLTAAFLLGISMSAGAETTLSYPIVDTNQGHCSDASQIVHRCATPGAKGFGQDAQYQGNLPSYTLNDDGTVTDNHTGLVWAQTTDLNGDGVINTDDKLTYAEATRYASQLRLGGYDDWRVPTIKELYSLMLFDGQDPSGVRGAGNYSIRPFLDHSVFGFGSGDTRAGERLIDSQYISSTKYVTTTMHGDETVFGVNFIDGRIKGYGITSRRGKEKKFYLLTVRGNTDYGINQFIDNGNKTITDRATGLIWQQDDSARGMDWFAALDYCQSLEIAGRSDWRLPSIKELHSIVDYTKSPETSNSAAIDDLFVTTPIVNEGGEKDYASYWSSTTHHNLKRSANAAYISFGRALGYMRDNWVDAHGAGAQRSAPKEYAGRDFPQGHGPQGDAVRFDNSVRCVTGGEVQFIQDSNLTERETKQYTLTGSEASTNKNRGSNQRGGDDQRREQRRW